jgi:haloacetate dehalogenase
MFEGFSQHRIDTGEATIHARVGGSGPAILLLHGYPQNLAEWALVAPLLARDFTVVCADLRGYGDSSKPDPLPDASNYAFRAMAADKVRLMERLGHTRFHVAGHDRGGRGAHRMALDWPDRVATLSTLDIVPTYDMYTRVDKRLAQTYWQWYFLPQRAPLPERLIGADPDFFYESCLVSVGGTGAGLAAFDQEMLAEYRRCWRPAEAITAWCSDYRAGASIDLEHDGADRDRRLQMPVQAMWGADGIMCTLFDIPALWRDRAENLTCTPIPGGHWFPEFSPQETAEALAAHAAKIAL